MSGQASLLEKTPERTDLVCTLRLPFPPSVNHYWRHIVLKKRAATIISEAGRKYQQLCAGLVLEQRQRHQLTGILAVYILLKMPDRRRRDVDNYCKSLLDALTKAGVWMDDGQIDLLTIERGDLEPPGEAVVEIYRL
jgi:crossover junction endodeoxyribonuclease RusA